MSVDLSEFEALEKQRGPKCGMGRAVKDLDGKDTEALAAAMEASHITARAIARWLEDRGVEVSCLTVQRHRRGDCACDS